MADCIITVYVTNESRDIDISKGLLARAGAPGLTKAMTAARVWEAHLIYDCFLVPVYIMQVAGTKNSWQVKHLIRM